MYKHYCINYFVHGEINLKLDPTFVKIFLMSCLFTSPIPITYHLLTAYSLITIIKDEVYCLRWLLHFKRSQCTIKRTLTPDRTQRFYLRSICYLYLVFCFHIKGRSLCYSSLHFNILDYLER